MSFYNYDNGSLDTNRTMSSQIEKKQYTTGSIVKMTAGVALVALTAASTYVDLPATGTYAVPFFIGLAGLAYFRSDSKANRFDAALEEAKKGSKELLDQIDKYNLTNEQENIVLDALFEKDPIAYRSQKDPKKTKPSTCLKIVKKAIELEHPHIVKNLHKYNLSQHERFGLVLDMIEVFPDELAANLPNYGLLPAEEKEIAHKLIKEPLANISADIKFFSHLTEEEKGDIALKALESNPTKVYENLSNYGFSDPTFITEKLQPYFELEKLIPLLEKDEPGALEKVLTCVQQITEKAPLPSVFLKKLCRTIDKRLLKATQKEAIALVHIINQHPSSITYSLINRVHERVQVLFPALSQYCYLDNCETKLKGKGFDYIGQNQEIPKDVHVYDTVFVGNLEKTVQAFIEDTEAKKALIPVTFEETLTNHFSPVYLEKDSKGQLRVFISDSTGELGEEKFAQEVMQHFKELPVADMYVLYPQRQFSTAICSVFTLNDMLEIIKSKDLFSVLDTHGDVELIKSVSMTYKRVNTPPIGWMKMNQSMTKTTQFISSKGNGLIEVSSNPFIHHKECTLKDFTHQVSYYAYDKYGVAKKQNKFPEWGMSKIFEALLIEASRAESN